MNMKNTLRTFSALNMPAPAIPVATADNLPDAINALGKAFTEFQSANDDRLNKQDAVTDEKVERINAAVTDAQDLIAKLQKDQARLTLTGLGRASNDDSVIQAAKFFSQARSKLVSFDEAAEEMETYQNYRKAFDALVRKGLRASILPSDMQNALSVGSDSDGGYLVPAEMSTEMEKRIHDTSPMRDQARVITIGSDAWEAPYKSSKGVSGGWVAEQGARSATGTGDLGVQRIVVHDQYAYPEVTQKMLDDGVLDIESFLVEDTEEEMARTENTAFVSGNGVGKPRGFLDYKTAAVTTDDDTRNWGVLQYVPAGADGAFPDASGIAGAKDPDALITTVSKLHPTYRPNANWAMNRSVEAEIRKLKDADGRYLIGFGDLRDNAFGFSLLGFPIVNFEDMPDIASNSYSIAFGDWSRGYVIIDRMGFRLLIDPYTNKPFVGFYITKRTGGDVRNFDAIKLIKFAES